MTISKRLYVVGAGGHSKVIVRTIELLGYEVVGIFDDAIEKRGQLLAGVPVIGTCEDFAKYPSLPTVIGVGDNAIRKHLSERLDVEWLTIVHPASIVDSSVRIGRGSVVMAGAVVQADTVLGDHCIINTGATVDHDCHLSDFCHISPGANLAGHCHLEEGVMFGIGANMIPSIRIGSWSTVGAGATVVRDLPSGVIATGVPARIK